MYENNENKYNNYYNRPYPYENRDTSQLYGHAPASGANPGTQVQPEPPRYGEQPPAGGNASAHSQPGGKKPRKAPRIIAAALGMALIGGAAGGGAAYAVMGQYQQPVAATGETAPAATVPTQGTAAAAGTGTNEISQVVNKASASVVEIVTEIPTNNFFAMQSTVAGAGSGVILTADGYIVTNHHVIEDASTVTIRTQDGTEYNAVLVGTDPKTDLAVIKVEAQGLTPVDFADSDSIQVGELAVAIGNPLGELGGTVTSGIISATGREITIDGEAMNLLQTSAAVNPGNSGGGLFDGNGNLVGVVNAKSSGVGVEGLAFAIPANTVREVTDDIINNGYVTGRPQFGISVIEISDPRDLLTYRLNRPGIYIAEVKNSASGFKAGDRIVSVDGVEIETSGDVSAALNSHEVGDTVTVTVERDGQNTDVSVTLIEQVPEGMEQAESKI